MIESDDLVALADIRHAPAIGDGLIASVDGFGEDDLVDDGGIEEAPHLFARRLIGIGRGIREEMQAAMHVGIFVRIGVRDRVDHGLRLLRRGAIVEIDQRLAIDLRATGSGNPGGSLRRRSCSPCIYACRVHAIRSGVLLEPVAETCSSSASTNGSSSSSSMISATNALTSSRARLLLSECRAPSGSRDGCRRSR